MATVNGLGTVRYDWCRRQDGTAEATLWFVIFFFPIAPLRREHLRVVGTEYERTGFINTLAAFCGVGSGWKTQIDLLGRVPNPAWRVILTYLKGFIGVPFITFFGPVLLFVFGTTIGLKRGQQMPDWVQIALPVFIVVITIWTVCVIALILDYAAGRFHIDSNVSDGHRKRKTPSGQGGGLSVICPDCDKTVTANDAHAGRKVRCPNCTAVIRVPRKSADRRSI